MSRHQWVTPKPAPHGEGGDPGDMQPTRGEQGAAGRAGAGRAQLGKAGAGVLIGQGLGHL